MANKLHELLMKAPVEGTFGIEIECEGENLYPVDNNYWKTEDDGSLRGVFPHSRCEWVFKKPQDLKKTLLAIKHLNNKQEEMGAKPSFSFRTSVHVQVNVLDLTWNQYCNFIYLYLLLEEPLMYFCGQERIGNRFCLRMQDAEGLLDVVQHIFQTGPGALRILNEDGIRYSAINLYTTRKYGSLEFRGMRGTLDVDVLATWISTLDGLKNISKEFNNVIEIHEYFKKTRNQTLIQRCLGEEFWYGSMDIDMNTSFSLCYELPFLFKNVEARKEQAPLNADGLVKWAEGVIARGQIIPNPLRDNPFDNVPVRRAQAHDLFIVDGGVE